MDMSISIKRAALSVLVVLAMFLPAMAMSAEQLGIVLMHGKGSSPSKGVGSLADALQGKDYLVENLEMPWSGRRDYDVDVKAAEQEIEAAIASLRGKGARKIFVAGHSQGGGFALHFGGHHTVDGIIAIAPGGDVGHQTFRQQLEDTMAEARRLVAEGKGQEKVRLADYEGSKGKYPVVTTPAAYITWFDPEGAMNADHAVSEMNKSTPVLYIAPTRDYPGLRKAKDRLFGALPSNALTKLYEPNADHTGAPSASTDEIARWTQEVAAH